MTGKIPFPDLTDPNVIFPIIKGKRPQRPRNFDAPGITPGVWVVAKKCWHDRAKQRPEVKTVLQDLENIANAGECAPRACFRLLRDLIGLWLSRPRTDTFHIETDLAWHSRLNAIFI